VITHSTGRAGERERGLTAAAAALRRGRLVGVPVDASYGIAADAFSDRGTAALRAAKARPDLTIPVLVPRIATVAGIALVDDQARRLMLDFWPGSLTLVLRAQPTLAWSLTDRSGRIAIRMPLHPVALELLERTGPLGVVAGAAPPSLPVDTRSAFPADLAEHLALVLDAGVLPAGRPSTVVDATGDVPVLVRSGAVPASDLVAACPQLVVPSSGNPPPGT